jgi:hypothetical protein
MSTQAAHFESLNGILEIVHRRGGRSEMKHRVQRSGNIDIFGYIVFDKPELILAYQMADIIYSSGNQVVDTNNFVAFGNQIITKVGT